MALIAAEMVERRITTLVFLIDQHRVALREGATLGVLPRQPDMMAFLQQRTERQRLASRPIDPDTGFDGLGAIFQEPLHRAVNPEAVGHLGHFAADVLED